MSAGSPRVGAWRRLGRIEDFRDRSIYVQRRPADGALILFLHGFPSSSFDFAPLLAVLEEERSANALLFDCLGFGLSEKPREHVYSLLWQADLAEALVDRHGAGEPVVIVAHDMGTSIATELIARDISGRLGFSLAGALLFNGSIVLEAASLTWAQRLLRTPLGPLAARLGSERLFRRQFSGLFSDRNPISEEDLADQWELFSRDGGSLIADRLIRYLGERERFAARWHGAIADWEGPLAFAWGMRDPVATPEVLDALRALRPSAPVEELADLGHYPQIESPAELARALRARLDPLL